jgi:hypothetical protein
VARVLTKQDSHGDVDEESVDPHNRHFATWLMNGAAGDESKLFVFAMGNLVHCAGDATSQGMLVQHLAVRAHLGEMDVVVGVMDDHPGGENEALVEGGLEFMLPAFDYYLEMLDEFVLSPAGFAELLDITAFYLDKYEEYFGLAVDRDRVEATLRSAFRDFPRDFPPCSPRAPWPLVRFARSGFRDVGALAEVSIDWNELLRVLGPILSPAFWNTYYDEEFFDYSATMLLGFENGQAFFDWFPNWSPGMMKSSVIQSLAYYLPGELQTEDGLFLRDLIWYDPSGAGDPLTEIDATNPPDSLTIALGLYVVPGRTSAEQTITVRVREDSPEAPVVAQATFEFATDPWEYAGDEPVTPVVGPTFDPQPSIAVGAGGFFAELVRGDDPNGPAYFTTNWEVYEQIEEIDMTKVAYTSQYAVYGQWPHSLEIVYPRKEAGQ